MNAIMNMLYLLFGIHWEIKQMGRTIIREQYVLGRIWSSQILRKF